MTFNDERLKDGKVHKVRLRDGRRAEVYLKPVCCSPHPIAGVVLYEDGDWDEDSWGPGGSICLNSGQTTNSDIVAYDDDPQEFPVAVRMKDGKPYGPFELNAEAGFFNDGGWTDAVLVIGRREGGAS